jgi:hypothetical protein
MADNVALTHRPAVEPLRWGLRGVVGSAFWKHIYLKKKWQCMEITYTFVSKIKINNGQKSTPHARHPNRRRP